jgi:thymidylate kinase
VVRQAMPKPALSVYLDVPAEVAMVRSSCRPEDPGDVYSEEYAVRRQLENYEARCGEVEHLRRLDGNRSAGELAAVVTRWIAEL